MEREIFYQLLLEVSSSQQLKEQLHRIINFPADIVDCFEPDILSNMQLMKKLVIENNSSEQLIGLSTSLLEALYNSSKPRKYEKFYTGLQKNLSRVNSLVKFENGSREQLLFCCLAKYYQRHRSSLSSPLLVSDDLLASLLATNVLTDIDLATIDKTDSKKDSVLLSILIGKSDWLQRLIVAMVQSGMLELLDEILPEFQQFFASNFKANLIDSRVQLSSSVGDTRRAARSLIGEALDFYFCMNYASLAIVDEKPAEKLQSASSDVCQPLSDTKSAAAGSPNLPVSPEKSSPQRQKQHFSASSGTSSSKEPASKQLKMADLIQDKDEFADEDDQEAAESGRQQMRVYQEELASSGVAGLNSLIVAPTGSGKTLVSIQITAARLAEDPSGNALVYFLADRKHLVEQQYEAFKAQLPAKFRDSIACVTGGEGERAPLSYQIRHHSVLIVSTQILLNSLNDKSEDGLNGDLTKFRLIIFDECHHCAKDHPSNKIMEFYFQIKERQPPHSAASISCRLPQIVGMTASPGTGQAHTTDEAVKHIISLCASLDCQRLVTVRSCADSLRSHVINPNVRLHSTGRKAYDAVRQSIDLLMDRAEQGLTAACERLGILAPSIPGRSSFLYTNFCGNLRSKLVARGPEIAAAWKRLHHCNVASLLWSLFRSTDAVSYIEEHLCDPNVLGREPTCKFDAELRDLLKLRLLPQMRGHCASHPSAASRSPALAQLRQILTEQFQRQADSRALVFVQQRCFTGVVKNFLDSEAAELSASGVQIGVMTGANAAGMSGGITQIGQSELLSQFRRGAVKILISTSVTEEGLDVQKCNAVVRFCHVTNEIAMVQSRGRGRAEGSVYHVIVPEEMNWLGDKERLNQARDDMMTEAVARLGQLSDEEFVAKVQQDQQEIRLDAREQRQLREAVANANRGSAFSIRCIDCEAVLTSSDRLRLAQGCHRLVLDAELLTSRLTARRESVTREFTDYTALGVALLCLCGTHVANLCRFKELPFAELKVQSIKFVNVRTNETYGPLKQWKLVKKFLTEEEIRNEDMISWAKEVPEVPKNLI